MHTNKKQSPLAEKIKTIPPTILEPKVAALYIVTQ